MIDENSMALHNSKSATANEKENEIGELKNWCNIMLT